jgi:hypothetical protein
MSGSSKKKGFLHSEPHKKPMNAMFLHRYYLFTDSVITESLVVLSQWPSKIFRFDRGSEPSKNLICRGPAGWRQICESQGSYIHTHTHAKVNTRHTSTSEHISTVMPINSASYNHLQQRTPSGVQWDFLHDSSLHHLLLYMYDCYNSLFFAVSASKSQEPLPMALQC